MDRSLLWSGALKRFRRYTKAFDATDLPDVLSEDEVKALEEELSALQEIAAIIQQALNRAQAAKA
jgi:hypothetical protein